MRCLALTVPLFLAASPVPAVTVWTGATTGTWDFATENWTEAGQATTFSNGADVLFDATALDSTVSIDAPGGVIAGNVDVVGQDYVISGATAASTLSVSGFLTVASGLTVTIDAGIVGDLALAGDGTIVLLGGLSGAVDTSAFDGELVLPPPPPDPDPAPVPLPAGLPLLLAALGGFLGVRVRGDMPA